MRPGSEMPPACVAMSNADLKGVCGCVLCNSTDNECADAIGLEYGGFCIVGFRWRAFGSRRSCVCESGIGNGYLRLP